VAVPLLLCVACRVSRCSCRLWLCCSCRLWLCCSCRLWLCCSCGLWQTAQLHQNAQLHQKNLKHPKKFEGVIYRFNHICYAIRCNACCIALYSRCYSVSACFVAFITPNSNIYAQNTAYANRFSFCHKKQPPFIVQYAQRPL